jgi:hypothetical protein
MKKIPQPVHPTFCQGARDDSHPAEFQSIAAKVGVEKGDPGYPSDGRASHGIGIEFLQSGAS